MRKIVMIIFVLVFFSISFAASEINIIIDSENVAFDEDYGKPFVDENNRTQVPLRAVLEKFGAKVGWQSETSTATVSFNDISIEIPIGKTYIIVNGKQVDNDTTSLIKDGRTYLPIRIVFENLGAEVSWEGDSQSVVVKSPNIEVDLPDVVVGTDIGQMADNIESVDQHGQTVSLSSLVGKPVLLSYYATWWSSCVHELGMLEEYNNTYDDLEIVAINLTTNDNVATVNKFVADNAYGYSMILDEDGSKSGPYKIKYIPFIVLIDENGIIQYKGTAPSTVSGLKSLYNTSFK